MYILLFFLLFLSQSPVRRKKEEEVQGGTAPRVFALAFRASCQSWQNSELRKKSKMTSIELVHMELDGAGVYVGLVSSEHIEVQVWG